jgi:SAM-dependent methyltransferase
VVAFNVLMSVDDPARAVDEAARVLRPGGYLCASIVHPLASSGEWRDDLFLVRDYLVERDHDQQVGGLVFANVHLPLQGWFGRLERAGFVVQSLRELPRVDDRRWSRVPMFLFLRAVKR